MKRSRINPVSARRRNRDKNYPEARRRVYDRCEGVCEAMWHPACNLRCEHVHHIAGRGGPDPHRLSNLLGVCHRCHDHIHANPREATQRGYLRSRL